MATVDQGYAAWLKAPARFTRATVGGAEAAWGKGAVDSSATTPLAFNVDAQAEAARQASFLSGPLARDTAIVMGRRSDLICRLITLVGDQLGYSAGKLAFVLGVAENANGTTTLTLLRRL